MRWLIGALLPVAMALGGCTSASYDLIETGSVPHKFADSDPQHFEGKGPQRHEYHGIDVSKWNGDIDWRQVRRSGVAFAFIKATEGKDRIDARFEDYWRGAAAAGIPHAPYHFYYFCSTADDQADWFIRNVPKASMHLPPVLDVEWNPDSKTCRTRPEAATVRAEMQRFMDRIEGHYGIRPIIYTSVDFHRDNLDGYFQNYHFWVRAVAQHPQEIYPGRRWTFWQYTSTGIVPGVKGETDINVFAGTEKNWRKWTANRVNP